MLNVIRYKTMTILKANGRQIHMHHDQGAKRPGKNQLRKLAQWLSDGCWGLNKTRIPVKNLRLTRANTVLLGLNGRPGTCLGLPDA